MPRSSRAPCPPVWSPVPAPISRRSSRLPWRRAMPASSEAARAGGADAATEHTATEHAAREQTATEQAAAEQVVVLPKHLHARPAGQVAQAAARYPETRIEPGADGR